jgi:nitrile hydratase subunit alpha
MKNDHGHGHHPQPLAPAALRAKALEEILIEKGMLTAEAVEKVASAYEKDIGPLNGAKVVARAWVDPGYKARLLTSATDAIAELGITGLQGEHLVALENSEQVHNVVVCTLCSCYPWPVLGLPPEWYKSPAYRARIVSEPRTVLREFGLELDDSVEVRVWDSSAELRYLVLPRRPAGSEGLSEAELAALVTRDSMVGVTEAKPVRKRHR